MKYVGFPIIVWVCLMSSKDKTEKFGFTTYGGKEKYAPLWLSGGKKNVPLRDNPTAIVYEQFLDRLSSIFLKNQRRFLEKSQEE